jgi:hypothetical protein
VHPRNDDQKKLQSDRNPIPAANYNLNETRCKKLNPARQIYPIRDGGKLVAACASTAFTPR